MLVTLYDEIKKVVTYCKRINNCKTSGICVHLHRLAECRLRGADAYPMPGAATAAGGFGSKG